MPTCPLIADPARYRPCIQNLLTDGLDVREYWLKLFEAHLETLGGLPLAGGRRLRDQPEWDRFAHGYLDGLAELRRDPRRRGKLNVLELTTFREEQFEAHGFLDPFVELKRRENDLALGLFARVLRDIDACQANRRTERLIRGVIAGNLFDMGSKAAVDAFGEGSFDFLAARDNVHPRPWPVDRLDAWQARLAQRRPPYRQAILFVDNAGPDVVLGILPLARELARMGIRVVLAANSEPALNDITAVELRALLATCEPLDAKLAECVRSGQITVVESGCAAPLIDLTNLSPECCDAAADSDLLILEGMGRAIESNYDACFSVDAIKLALIKDRMVARVLGVNLFDPIFRFDPAGP
jgi:damage-control phosphatase, subfamily II, stand-alone protein